MSNCDKELIYKLKKDKALREAWKATIVVSVISSWSDHRKKTGKVAMNREDRYNIANNAAEHFLQLLCEEVEYPEGR